MSALRKIEYGNFGGKQLTQIA